MKTNAPVHLRWAAVVFCLAVVFCPVFTAPVQAQSGGVHFGRLSIEQGLSQVTVYSIFQDRTGFMWFGTEDGLNRYDGYTFRIYKRDPEDPLSLGANTIRVIYEDRAERLWVGTEGGGLEYFDRSTGRFIHYRHNPDDPNSLSQDTVTAIYEAPDGVLWIGTDQGLNRFDPAAGQFKRYLPDPANPSSLSHARVTVIRGETSGALWVATSEGLNRFDPISEQFSQYQHHPDDPNSLCHNEILTLWAPQEGGLWVGTLDGLDYLDPHSGHFRHYRYDPENPRSLDNDEITQLYQDAAGTLWVGTPNALNEFDGQGFTRYQHDPRTPDSLAPGGIDSLYEDSSGVLWIGSNIGGLSKLDRKARRFEHYANNPDDPDSLDSNIVWSLYEDQREMLWVGTASGGLNQFEQSSGRFIHYQHDQADPDSLSSTAVLAVSGDSSGAIWVGTWGGGVNKLEADQIKGPDGGGGRFIHYRHDPDNPDSLGDDVVWAIYEDAAGIMWFGTFGAGLDRFDPQTGSFSHYRHDADNPNSLSGDIVLSIYEDRAGVLWVGTTQGLNQFDRQTGRFRHYKNDPSDPTSLSSNAVAVIFEDTAGHLWLGTDDGLSRFEPASETFVHYTEKDGLANDSVAGILEDENGNLWISSSQGLSRLDPRSGLVKNYDVRDGLQSNEFNRGAFAQGQSGEMYFGGVNGFNAFHPDQVLDNPHIPPLALTEFYLFNQPAAPGGDSPLQKPIEESDELHLSYRDYVFSFEFAALDFSIPEKNRYAYMLEGFDQDWNYVDSKRRFASYANLPAGDYTFKVKGSNNDGVWNEEGAAVRITITPPPWRTWWAYTLYVLLALGLIGFYIRYRLRELERKHLEQTMWAVQKERDRIAALLEARRQLVATISHDLRSPVAVVRGQLEAALAQEENWQPPPRHTLEVILQELDRLRALLDDLFTLSKLEVDRLSLRLASVEGVALTRRAIEALAGPAWQQGKVQVVLGETETDEIWLRADAQRLLQILMNLLHNAVRHTLPGGLVVVHLKRQGKWVCIQVQDTGEGILPEDLPHIWERFYRGQTQAGGGTGLGLALVKELTEAMGGTVTVESTPGEGSRFEVLLPGE